MAATKVLKCSCQHAAQDSIYGHGLRLHNKCKDSKAGNAPEYRCTVCATRKAG